MSQDNVAANLKAARESAGLTGKQAAKQLQISLITLWRMEAGMREPKATLFKRMADTYRWSPNRLLNWED